jgi:copper chaperone
MTTTTLTVPDISCSHCKDSIEGAVGQLPGVDDVSVAIEPKTVTVAYDGTTTSLDDITAAIEAVGYDVAAGG